MRCCFCRSGCRGFTRTSASSSRGNEARYEKENALDCSPGHLGDDALCRLGRVRSDVAVELAPARFVRVASYHVLAGSCPLGPVPDSVWKNWRAAIRPLQFSRAYARSLGEDDARGARKSPRPLGAVWWLRTPGGEGDSVIRNDRLLTSKAVVVTRGDVWMFKREAACIQIEYRISFRPLSRSILIAEFTA